jgi:hypothetical protein
MRDRKVPIPTELLEDESMQNARFERPHAGSAEGVFNSPLDACATNDIRKDSS